MTQEQERLLIRKYATAFLTSQIIHAYNEFAQKYPDCIPAMRLEDAEGTSKRLDEQSRWQTVKYLDKKSQATFKRTIGKDGSEYINCSHNHPVQAGQKYIYLFPMLSNEQMTTSIDCIRDQKFRDPSTTGKDYYLSLYFVNKSVKARAQDPTSGCLSHFGNGDYDLDGNPKNGLSEIALHCEDYNPDNFVSQTRFIDPYIGLQLLIDGDLTLKNLAHAREMVCAKLEEYSKSSDPKQKGMYEQYLELRDFCDYVAKAENLDILPREDKGNKTYDEDYEDEYDAYGNKKPSRAQNPRYTADANVREVIEIIDSLIANNSSNEEINACLKAYQDAKIFDSATISAAAKLCSYDVNKKAEPKRYVPDPHAPEVFEMAEIETKTNDHVQ